MEIKQLIETQNSSVATEYINSNKVEGLVGHHVMHVACGKSHSAVLTSKGDVFTWGRGSEGLV